jgi:hypothetical protein
VGKIRKKPKKINAGPTYSQGVSLLLSIICVLSPI